MLLATNAILKGLNLDIADALFAQSVGQVIVFIIMVYIKQRSLWIWTVEEDKSINNIRLMLILGAVLGTISRVTDILAIKYMPLGDAMTIILSQSIPTAILAAIVFKDRLRLIKISCLILVVSGVTLVIRPPFLFDTDSDDGFNINYLGHNSTQFPSKSRPCDNNSCYYIGAASAVGCMITQSIFYVNFNYFIKNARDLMLFYHGLGCLFVALVLPFVCDGSQKIINQSDKTIIYSSLQWLGLFGYATLLISLLILRYEAVKLVGPVVFGFVRSTEILLSYCAQLIMFNTIPEVSTIIGSVFVVISCIIVLIEDNIVEILPKTLKNIF